MGLRTTSATKAISGRGLQLEVGRGRSLPQGPTNFRLVMLMGLRIGWGSLIYRENNFISWLQGQAKPWPQPDPYPTHRETLNPAYGLSLNLAHGLTPSPWPHIDLSSSALP